MTKSHTLNQVYLNAKNLIEKYQVAVAGHVLEAAFEIGERKGSPVLNCTVKYVREFEYKFYGSADTPESALLFFEKSILNEIKESYKEDVSVEIPEKRIYQSML